MNKASKDNSSHKVSEEANKFADIDVSLLCSCRASEVDGYLHFG
ncbi:MULTISPECIES: hypothetical protein [Vibrio harveyi group]|nr:MULTISPECIES: hypothetical protein [Vibrio harveyi group]